MNIFFMFNYLDFPSYISQDKYNQGWYKGENKNCVYSPIKCLYDNWQNIHCIYCRQQHKSTDTDNDFYIKRNSIRNIHFNIGKYINDNDYGEIITFDKNVENGYYSVKLTTDSHTFQSCNKIGRYFINGCELVCDAEYLNPFANPKKWYTPLKTE